MPALLCPSSSARWVLILTRIEPSFASSDEPVLARQVRSLLEMLASILSVDRGSTAALGGRWIVAWGRLVMVTAPPWASTTVCTIESPSPVPRYSRVQLVGLLTQYVSHQADHTFISR